MHFFPIDRMIDLVRNAKQDSDSLYFLNLMYLGEMLTKIITAGLVSAIGDDADRNRYRQIYRLVRADGLGEWPQVIDETLNGPASQHLLPEANKEKKELTQRLGVGSWQHNSVNLLNEAWIETRIKNEELPQKIPLARWFNDFVILRNGTRGHGATKNSIYKTVCPLLFDSLESIIDNFYLFKRQWAFLHENLSGKYRVSNWTEDSESFDFLKTKALGNIKYEDGVYINFDKPTYVELIRSDAERGDFFFPNGNFKNSKFELISYLTDYKTEGDSSPYFAPISSLPESETHGLGDLEPRGNCFSNLPPIPNRYINRPHLEESLYEILSDDRHPVVTLLGRGGIGKTSLALKVLNRIISKSPFEVIFWFSARDIDLLPEGPKAVKPNVLTLKDIANEFVRLLDPKEKKEKSFSPENFFSASLTKSYTGKPMLFVFDNFETIRNPSELYNWIDSYIRLPNKVLITTRAREFKADYPVDISGMEESECLALVDSVGEHLRINSILKNSYKNDLFIETDGHPYVIKIILGEVAKAQKLVNANNIVAGKEQVLDALFERSYSQLSLGAQKVFLTLCNWRSNIPEIALEAVLLGRSPDEKFNVSDAIDELTLCSLIEKRVSEQDGTTFLSTPLSASIFGRRKFSVSILKSSIEADLEVLYYLGASKSTDIKHGIEPRIKRMFKSIAGQISDDPLKLSDYIPILEFIAAKYPYAWKLLANLYEESDLGSNIDNAIRSINKFLESDKIDNEDRKFGWQYLRTLYNRSENFLGEAHALVEQCQLNETTIEEISEGANRLNSLLREKLDLDTPERMILVRKLADVFEKRIKDPYISGKDCSRLAWLYLKLHEEKKAKKYAEMGLELEPENQYCQNIVDRLDRESFL